ncbi:MAG TPA: hypothetical protein VGX24_06870 [Pyrinomonadaceae bacterium]|jgi:hypothetical protein|nr:hypothetical protein [Pyrinomonadaceae bacterium]
MDLPESQVESFIVKLWTETVTVNGGGVQRVKWHGQITHVSGGVRHYFKDLDEIKIFIEPYLAEMGAEVGGRWRLRHWLRRLSLHAD